MLFRFLDSLDDIACFERHVSVIAAKHAARDIQPELFQDWGNGFIAGIRDQLGPELATPEVMDAWSEAYAYLATLMITKQREIAAQRASESGGWSGFRCFIVNSLEPVDKHGSAKAYKMCLVPEDGLPTLVQTPGQYVCVRVKMPIEDCASPVPFYRNYQLDGIPIQDSYEIKITERYSYRSQSSSNEALLKFLRVGTKLDLSVPLGGFLMTKHTNIHELESALA